MEPTSAPPADLDSTPAPIGARAGEYEITGVLGHGAMGTVYAGIHPLIGTEVAIKVVHGGLAGDPVLIGRFLQEARAVNRIRHPSIIEVFAFGSSPELGQYLVMPRLHGQSLGDRLARHGPMPLAEVLIVARQIADGLDAAHQAGICHRDLKPDNVFLVEDHRVKILDFGVAKLLGAEAVTVTQGRQWLGTPLYMSPEQWDGEGVDHRADIYALGVMVHHALTGRYPFEAESPIALMKMHVDDAPTPASRHGAPGFVDAVIARALAKDKDARHASAGAFCDELVAAAAQPRGRRRGWRTAAQVAVLGLAILFAEPAPRRALPPPVLPSPPPVVAIPPAVVPAPGRARVLLERAAVLDAIPIVLTPVTRKRAPASWGETVDPF